MSDDTRKLLIVRSGRPDVIVEIPAKAKVTFAAINPERGHGGYGNAVVRIYHTENQQLAVFANVIEFRDLSLPVQHKKIKVKSKLARQQSPDMLEVEESYSEEGEWEDAKVVEF